MASKHGLGRGLGALLAPTAPTSSAGAPAVTEIPIDAVRASDHQPRKSFDDSTLQELAASIRRTGLLQPILVRPDGAGYQLIAGERRWRAARMAGLDRVPALIRETSNAESLELALVENLLREDLNPMEEAEAYQRLIGEFSWTQEELAERVGKERSSVANWLRLLRLPEAIQADLREGRLTMGHARALLSLASVKEQLRLRDEILAHAWSVRATEEGVQRARTVPARRAPRRRSAELAAVEETLREALTARVRVTGSEQRGRVEVAYSSREELDRIVELITGRTVR